MDMRAAIADVEREVASWEGVTTGPHRFGGVEFGYGRAEIGHFHRSGLLDVPFPLPLHDQLIQEERAEIHHVLPKSGWVSFRMHSAADTAGALWLLRLSYLRYRLGRVGQAQGGVLSGPERIAQGLSDLADLGLTPAMRAAFEKAAPAAGLPLPGP